MRRLGLFLVAAMVVLPGAASAQRRPRPGEPPRPPVVRPGQGARPSREPVAKDSAARDTTQKDIVEWAEMDSVMAELMARAGYAVTRYQGNTVVFDARRREMTLIGKAAVQREPSTLASDTIIYNDSTKRVVAYGYPSTLRDPSQQAADLVANGKLEYDMESKRGLASNVRTAFDAGERWYIAGERTAPVLADSATGQQSAFYALNGDITSCDLEVPDYHFRAKEIKVVAKTTLVARPAVLYIADVPVMWLPFIFQDLHPGRRSGLLRPFFGVSEVFRNSPTYRRHIEKLGYYWAISDYLDATAWLDWRSGARPTAGDPGSLRGTGNLQYVWIDRFLRGSISGSHHALKDGTSNSALSWQHNQKFSETSTLAANVNYATNTSIQRQQTYNPFIATAVIGSLLNYSQQVGPLNLSAGGSRKQFPGRPQVDQSFPNLSLSTRGPVNIGPRIVWTPSFAYRNDAVLNIDGGGDLTRRFFQKPDGNLDSVRLKGRNSRSVGIDFQTPLEIFGFTWRNSISISDQVANYPQSRVVFGADTSVGETRVFGRTYRTSVDYNTGIDLPRVLQGTWNLVPSVNIVNVDQGAAYFVRSEFTGDKYVSQSKRLVYGLSASPTFFGLFPGFGIVSRLRHSFQPSVRYDYAPSKEVSEEFLRALNSKRSGYLGSLAQNRVSLGMSTNIEAKMRGDSAQSAEGGRKVKLVSLNFDQLAYDFERLRVTGQGFTSDRFGYNASSDLLPGLNVRVGYSLFEGNVQSDTAKFDPYRENVSATFSINRNSNPFVLLNRVLGRAIPLRNPGIESVQQTPSDREAQQVAQQPVAGNIGAQAIVPPSGAGWTASFTYSSNRQRPVVGSVLLDPAQPCIDAANGNPIQIQNCRSQNFSQDFGNTSTFGGQIFRQPPQETLQFSTSLNVTPKWSAQWQSSYDFELNDFASHNVTLQRELHDWRAIFMFLQAPNGNFAFNFSIALKAEENLKFDYSKQTYRPDRR